MTPLAARVVDCMPISKSRLPDFPFDEVRVLLSRVTVMSGRKICPDCRPQPQFRTYRAQIFTNRRPCCMRYNQKVGSRTDERYKCRQLFSKIPRSQNIAALLRTMNFGQKLSWPKSAPNDAWTPIQPSHISSEPIYPI